MTINNTPKVSQTVATTTPSTGDDAPPSGRAPSPDVSGLPPTRTTNAEAPPPRRQIVNVGAAAPAEDLRLAMENLVRGHVTGALRDDVKARLDANATVLAGAGITTPAALNRFMSECWRHDSGLAAGALGLTGNAGYFTGMTLANEKFVAMLPKSILGNAPLLGALVGLGVGALDVLISVAGAAVLKPKLYNGEGGNLPPSVPRPSDLHTWMKAVGEATGLNLLKNSTRPMAPPLQALYEKSQGHLPAGSIDRLWSDRIDVSLLDGGLGFASAAIKEVLKLGHGAPYDLRLLLRDDLQGVVDKKNGTVQDSAGAMARRAAGALAAPVPVAVVGVIGAFISALFAANTTIDQYGHSQVDPVPADRADPGIMAIKRTSSVVMMGAMTAAIELGAPLVAKGAASAWQHLQGTHLPDIGGWLRGLLPAAPQTPQPMA